MMMLESVPAPVQNKLRHSFRPLAVFTTAHVPVQPLPRALQRGLCRSCIAGEMDLLGTGYHAFSIHTQIIRVKICQSILQQTKEGFVYSLDVTWHHGGPQAHDGRYTLAGLMRPSFKHHLAHLNLQVQQARGSDRRWMIQWSPRRWQCQWSLALKFSLQVEAGSVAGVMPSTLKTSDCST
jgi:hypothetical protein